jgi:hypothetical protein
MRPMTGMPMTHRRHRPLLLLATAGLAACGSSGPSTASPTARAEETRSAQQIYDDFLTSMASERSVHIAGHQVDTGGASNDIDVLDTQNAASITLTVQGTSIYMVVTPNRVYASQSRNGPWVTAPADLATNARSLTLASTVRCARLEHGGLTRGAVSTVNGRRVVAVEDDGRAPGASPSTVYVSVTGPPRLVRVVQHAVATPGGRPDCGQAGSGGSPGVSNATFDFSEWGAAVTVTPPPSAAL